MPDDPLDNAESSYKTFSLLDASKIKRTHISLLHMPQLFKNCMESPIIPGLGNKALISTVILVDAGCTVCSDRKIV